MMEQKLQTAADCLPEPRSDFATVEERLHTNRRKREPSRPRKRLVAALLLTALLVGCVAIYEPDYHLYNGNWWHFLPGAYDLAEVLGQEDTISKKAARQLGITLPETLGGHPIVDYDRYNLTNRDVPIWIAWLSPRYVYQSSYYGVELEKPYVTSDGREGTYHWREGIEVTYGPTDDSVWRRQFHYDDNNIYIGNSQLHEGLTRKSIDSEEYNGFTLFVEEITVTTSELPLWRVTWVNEEKGVVFSVDEHFKNADIPMGYAKEIIDLNRE